MKKLLADFLKIKEDDILGYRFVTEHNLSILSEFDYGKTQTFVDGEIYKPQYRVTVNRLAIDECVDLEELLVFLYNKIS